MQAWHGCHNLLEEIDLHQFTPLPISLEHAQLAGKLPYIHKDPFDRILIAQTIHEKLTFVTIPAEIDLTIEFEKPFEFFMQFPLTDGDYWGFEENVFTISIDGRIDSIWLRILHFINKIVPIIPEQFAQFLPIVDISEVLESFGIPSMFEIDFPVNLDHYKSTNFFQVNGNENVNTKGGTFNCKKISILDDNANFYYCGDAKNVVKLCAQISDYIPILEDINLEIVETNTI